MRRGFLRVSIQAKFQPGCWPVLEGIGKRPRDRRMHYRRSRRAAEQIPFERTQDGRLGPQTTNAQLEKDEEHFHRVPVVDTTLLNLLGAVASGFRNERHVNSGTNSEAGR